jgi:general secretion pathway protein L
VSGLFDKPLKFWNSFIDAAAQGVIGLVDRVAPPRRLTLLETPDGRLVAFAGGANEPTGFFALDAKGALVADGGGTVVSARGAIVDLVLSKGRFLTRDLPLPAQADDFLERILRMQIDRLTPWTPDRASFGYVVRERKADKINVSLAAAERGVVQPFIDAVAALKPRSLRAFAESGAGSRIPLSSQGQAGSGGRVLRGVLNGALIAVSLGLLGTSIWTTWEASDLDAQYDATQRRIANARAGLRGEDPATAAERAILLRKTRGPNVSVMFNELSRALPDDTYLTDVELTGTKLRVIGVSRDASSLISQVEKSPAFSDASFFAPTTRNAGDGGEQFRLEATMRAGKGGAP